VKLSGFLNGNPELNNEKREKGKKGEKGFSGGPTFSPIDEFLFDSIT
jgi:hypothetical protein